MKNLMRELAPADARIRHNYPDSQIRWADLTDLVNRIYYARQFNESVVMPEVVMLEHMLCTMASTDRRARLDLISEFINLNSYLELIRSFGFRPELLWFRVSPERFNREEILRLARTFPGAIIECKTDFPVHC